MCEYCLSLKMNKILTSTTTWVNLEKIMLSEITQTQKDKYYMIPFYKVPRVINSLSQKVKLWLRGPGGGSKRKFLFNG